MLHKTQRGFWETDVRALNLKNPEVLRFYVERKVKIGDWNALNRRVLKKLLPQLDIDPHLRKLLGSSLSSRSYETAHSAAKKGPHRRRSKRTAR